MTQLFQRAALEEHVARAVDFLHLRRFAEAERESRTALRADPGHRDATLILANILSVTSRNPEAIATLREGLHKRPKDPLFLFHTAGCAFALGRLEESQQAITKFLAVMAEDSRLLGEHRNRYIVDARTLRRAIKARQSLSREPTSSESQPHAETKRIHAGGARVGRERAGLLQPSLFDAVPGIDVGETEADRLASPPRDADARSEDGPVLSPPSKAPPAAGTEERDPARSAQALAALVEAPSIPSSEAPDSLLPPAFPFPSTAGGTLQSGLLAARVPLRVEEDRGWIAGDADPSWAPWADDPWSEDLEERDLLIESQRIRLLGQYEELLCLPMLSGVEKLDYQVETVRKILRRLNGRALLCDEVGLGKTIEAGMVIKEYLLRGLVQSALVLVPPGLVRQWREEMSQKFGLEFVVWGEPRAETGFETGDGRGPVLAIGSIASARLERNIESFREKEWDMIVVDEAHHLRSRSTRSWALVNSLRKRFVLLLSATPVHNNLMEIYELATLVRPGLLGTPAEFRRRFVGMGKNGRVPDPDGKNTRIPDPNPLREALAEVMVRNTRSHADVILPKRFATTLVLEPLAAEAAAYSAASTYTSLSYSDTKTDPTARMGLRHLLGCAGSGPRAVVRTAARMLKGLLFSDAGLIENVCGGPQDAASLDLPGNSAVAADERRLLLEEVIASASVSEPSAKARRLCEMVSGSGEQVIVYCRYRATLAELEEVLSASGIPHAVYHGGLTRAEKDRAIDAFREGARVLLSTESGGEGRNIQFCRTIVNYDLPWDPMLIEQRIGRVHRIGQRRDVFVFNLVLAGTLEEELLRILEEKIHLFELIVGEVDSILGHLERREEFADILLGLWAGSRDEQERRRNFEEFGNELVAAQASYEREKLLDESLFGDDLEV